MSFKCYAAAQHMNNEVAVMSAMVFSQFTYLADMGSMIGYGEDPDDHVEVFGIEVEHRDHEELVMEESI